MKNLNVAKNRFELLKSKRVSDESERDSSAESYLKTTGKCDIVMYLPIDVVMMTSSSSSSSRGGGGAWRRRRERLDSTA